MAQVFNPKDTSFNGVPVAADWIHDLESSDSRLHKERVIEKAFMAAKLGSSSAQIFLFNCYLAYNPFYTYNIKQVPETENIVGQPNPWPQFWALCEALRTRSVTGNHMRQMVEECSRQFDSQEWNDMCRRVLIKDLRCGISEKTLNKILGKSDWAIPVFTCQLATDSADHPNKMTGRARIECKLDGVRVLAVIDNNGAVTLYSRNGKVFENFSVIEDQLIGNALEIKRVLANGAPIVLDGEIVGESFQTLMKQARRKRDANANDSKFYVFDWVSLDAFKRGSQIQLSQERRSEKLELLRPLLDSNPSVRIMPGIEVDLDTSVGKSTMQKFAQDAVAEGFEGIMIKNLQAHYECKRSSNWMKWKPTITVDLEVVNLEEGTGRNLGRLGALVCEGSDNGRHITVNVGSGLSDSDRDEFWNYHVNGNNIVGQIVEVEADAVTQNQDGSYSLRFPRFVRFRGFDVGEKL